MWTCPQCERNFKNANQSHMCSSVSIDDLLEGKPESLLVAFDKLLVGVIDWEPCSVGTSTRTVVFAKEKAWLIVRPMSKQLDVKFYYPEIIQHQFISKTTHHGSLYAHHIRIQNEEQMNDDFFRLLRKGFDVS